MGSHWGSVTLGQGHISLSPSAPPGWGHGRLWLSALDQSSIHRASASSTTSSRVCLSVGGAEAASPHTALHLPTPLSAQALCPDYRIQDSTRIFARFGRECGFLFSSITSGMHLSDVRPFIQRKELFRINFAYSSFRELIKPSYANYCYIKYRYITLVCECAERERERERERETLMKWKVLEGCRTSEPLHDTLVLLFMKIINIWQRVVTWQFIILFKSR